MNLYDGSTAASSPPALPAAVAPGYYTNGVPGTTPRTIIEDWHLNAMQEEIVNEIAAAGLAPSRSDNTQLKQAILAQIASAVNAETAARTAAINAAITALVGGAPGALDTLNELATALNDDAAFSTTITNLLALKAPLISPGFTGAPTSANAPAAGDSSTKVPNTAWVEGEILTRISPGFVSWYAASTPPAGWLECNGASLSTSTYAALFAVVGYTFGGIGSNFTLPDLRGQFIRGWDHGRGVDTGRVFGTNQADAFQGHFHSLAGVPEDGSGYGYTGTNGVSSTSLTATGAPISDGSDAAPRTSAETRPVNVALLPCIKF